MWFLKTAAPGALRGIGVPAGRRGRGIAIVARTNSTDVLSGSPDRAVGDHAAAGKPVTRECIGARPACKAGSRFRADLARDGRDLAGCEGISRVNLFRGGRQRRRCRTIVAATETGWPRSRGAVRGTVTLHTARAIVIGASATRRRIRSSCRSIGEIVVDRFMRRACVTCRWPDRVRARVAVRPAHPVQRRGIPYRRLVRPGRNSGRVFTDRGAVASKFFDVRIPRAS